MPASSGSWGWRSCERGAVVCKASEHDERDGPSVARPVGSRVRAERRGDVGGADERFPATPLVGRELAVDEEDDVDAAAAAVDRDVEARPTPTLREIAQEAPRLIPDLAPLAGNVATVGFIAGGALLAAGVVVFLTAPTRAHAATTGLEVAPLLAPRAGGLAVLGRW